MRYFLKLQYLGKNFVGWQKQNEGLTVQGQIESALEIYFKEKTPIVGCGRTDTGVHASNYYAHFEAEILDKTDFLYRINRILGFDISIDDVITVSSDLHARYNASRREYKYKMTVIKSPFGQPIKYFYPFTPRPELVLLQKAALLIKASSSFEGFCKTGTDVNNYHCTIHDCNWHLENGEYTFTIAANRFLRGMVRLLVGACINVAIDKISLNNLENSLNTGNRLSLIWSVPAHGLCLTNVQYDDLERTNQEVISG